jgi:hypothetical protein
MCYLRRCSRPNSSQQNPRPATNRLSRTTNFFLEDGLRAMDERLEHFLPDSAVLLHVALRPHTASVMGHWPVRCLWLYRSRSRGHNDRRGGETNQESGGRADAKGRSKQINRRGGSQRTTRIGFCQGQDMMNAQAVYLHSVRITHMIGWGTLSRHLGAAVRTPPYVVVAIIWKFGMLRQATSSLIIFPRIHLQLSLLLYSSATLLMSVVSQKQRRLFRSTGTTPNES